MSGYQNKVKHLAGDKQKGEVQLVVNLFQSVLDGFIRGEMKKEEAEPSKVKRDRHVLAPSAPTFLAELSLTLLVVCFSPLKLERRGGKRIKVYVFKPLNSVCVVIVFN